MAKGRDKHQARVGALSLLGKDLARRARSHCELCGASGVSLTILEVPPVPEEPDPERAIMVCDTCREQVENPKRMDPNHWHCLNTSVWSEVPAVQVMAVTLLRRLTSDTGSGEAWADELAETLYLSPEVEAWLETVE